MRVVALIASYNERRFIGACLDHLKQHGVDAYLVDNGSTDNTVEIAERRLGRNLIGIEDFPRGGGDAYDWRGLLRRKEQLTQELDADWFIHLDPDEIRLPPRRDETLAEAFERVDRAGFNAVNFREFTFMPTREQPDHDHPEFQRTLRTYYHFEPRFPHQVKAWKATDAVELVESGGHEVRLPDLRMCPEPFPFKHYIFLSVPHAIEKYVERRYDREEVESGWHGWRASIAAAEIDLPGEAELSRADSDSDLEPGDPRTTHWLERTSTGAGDPPKAPAGFHVLREGPREETPDGERGARIVHRGAGRRAEVALTFDDGPSRWTREIAASFERRGCRATFFLRGAAVEQRPGTVARLAAAGHELGNHLWSHSNAAEQSVSELRMEIGRTADAIEATGAPRPRLVRPPYFSAPRTVAEAAGRAAGPVVLRSIGSSDWEANSAEEVLAPILSQIQAGDIVCLHDGVSGDKHDSDSRQPTADAVERLVPALLERGLRPVTVSELLR